MDGWCNLAQNPGYMGVMHDIPTLLQRSFLWNIRRDRPELSRPLLPGEYFDVMGVPVHRPA
eukprot:8061732-Lingulodinium_polyedra.AAC.1